MQQLQRVPLGSQPSSTLTSAQPYDASLQPALLPLAASFLRNLRILDKCWLLRAALPVSTLTSVSQACLSLGVYALLSSRRSADSGTGATAAAAAAVPSSRLGCRLLSPDTLPALRLAEVPYVRSSLWRVPAGRGGKQGKAPEAGQSSRQFIRLFKHNPLWWQVSTSSSSMLQQGAPAVLAMRWCGRCKVLTTIVHSHVSCRRNHTLSLQPVPLVEASHITHS